MTYGETATARLAIGSGLHYHGFESVSETFLNLDYNNGPFYFYTLFLWLFSLFECIFGKIINFHCFPILNSKIQFVFVVLCFNYKNYLKFLDTIPFFVFFEKKIEVLYFYV